MLVAAVVDNFVAVADDFGCAVALGAAPAVLAVAVALADRVAVQEVGALGPGAAPRVALEVVVTRVRRHFLPVQAL